MRIDDEGRRAAVSQALASASFSGSTSAAMSLSSSDHLERAGVAPVAGLALLDEAANRRDGATGSYPATLLKAALSHKGTAMLGMEELGMQADTLEKKVSISERAYKILTEQVGFAPQDIIFDPNIFAIATGIEEHNNYAVDFIEATKIIKQKMQWHW